MEDFLNKHDLIYQRAYAVKPGTSRPGIVRLGIYIDKLREIVGDGGPDYMLASSVRPREFTYCNCINYGPNDGLDADALSAAETNLRGRMLETADFFRRVPGCEGCYAAGPAPCVGQRRARAIHCDWELTPKDLVEARQFDDQVGCFSFIDNGPDLVRDAGAYGIPYRALLPGGMDNMLLAGRMMTVDHWAHDSTRMTACCLVCGQAAGTAAALCAESGSRPRSLDVRRLQETLIAHGAVLRLKEDKR